MKKVLFMITVMLSMFCIAAYAEKVDETQIKSTQAIGNLLRVELYSGEEYVTDAENNICGGPYKQVSDMSGYCDVTDFDGNKILFDLDGTILAKASANYDINYPCNGIYTIRERKEEHAELIVYDYETKKELLHTTGSFLYYLEQQPDKMFIESNGKYAIIDNKCNFITDYIYDDVKKRFNPEYVPFPKAYAIVVQDGVEKYIDWNLNEINLDSCEGEFFITNCRNIYKDYYVLESGNRLALYDMTADKILFPYQTEFSFSQMNDKYIIVKKGNEEAVLDYSGKIVIPYSNSRLSFTDDGLISYYHYDGNTAYEGILNPENGERIEKPLENMGYFYKVLGETEKENISFGTIVSGNMAANIRNEDLQKFLDVYWNFTYERVIAPLDSYDNRDETYIKLWNTDRTKSYTIYSNSGILFGAFGEPTQSHGETKSNYVWYLPVVGNGRNALYTAFKTVRHTYFDKNYDRYFEAQREMTEADKPEIPTKNLLSLDTASEWAIPEIQRAAACNLLPYELTDKYTESITRLDFCKLAYKAIITEFSPSADSRMGEWYAADHIINERGLIEKFNEIHYTDYIDDKIKFLSAAGIIYGMDDGTFAPYEFITREQAAAILYRMAEFLGNKTIIEPQNKIYYSYDGHLISDWAEVAVKSMYEMEIMKGVGENEFSSQGTYTVEQAIATMIRLYECY